MQNDDDIPSPSYSLPLLMINRTPKATTLAEYEDDDLSDGASTIQNDMQYSQSNFSMSSSNTLKAVSLKTPSIFSHKLSESEVKNAAEKDDDTTIWIKEGENSGVASEIFEVDSRTVEDSINFNKKFSGLPEIIYTKKKSYKRNQRQRKRYLHGVKQPSLLVRKSNMKCKVLRHKLRKNTVKPTKNIVLKKDKRNLNNELDPKNTIPRVQSTSINMIKKGLAKENLLRSVIYSFSKETGQTVSQLSLSDSGNSKCEINTTVCLQKKPEEKSATEVKSDRSVYKDESIKVCTVLTENREILSKSSKTLVSAEKIYAHNTLSDIMANTYSSKPSVYNKEQTYHDESLSGITLKPASYGIANDSSFSMKTKSSNTTLKPQTDSLEAKKAAPDTPLAKVNVSHQECNMKHEYQIEPTTSSNTNNSKSCTYEMKHCTSSFKNLNTQNNSPEVPNILKKNYSIPNNNIIKAVLDDVEQNREEKDYSKIDGDMWDKLKAALDHRIQKLECNIIDKIMTEVRKVMASWAESINMASLKASDKYLILDKNKLFPEIFRQQELHQSLERISTALQCDLLENKKIDQVILKLKLDSNVKKGENQDSVYIIKKPNFMKNYLEVLRSPPEKVLPDDPYSKGDLVTVSVATEEVTVNENFFYTKSCIRGVFKFIHENCIVLQTIPMFFIVVAAVYCLIVIITRSH